MRAVVLALVLVGCQSSTPPAPKVEAAPIVIDVYADLVCPWCFIGTERLEKVLASSPVASRVVVKHHAFLLDPSTPPEGHDLRAMLAQKYGRDPSQMFAPAEAQARASGLPLDFSKVTHTYATSAGHALLAQAESKGTQRQLKQALFRAYFLEGKNISDGQVLTEVASRHGFTADEVTKTLSSSDALAQVSRDDQQAHQRGITGVPFFVFCGGQTLSGAQPEAVMAQALAACAR